MAKPVRASGVEAEPVVWRWMNRIPEGMLTLVAGKPDQGKGLFASYLAAEVSADGGNVLYSAAEDDPARMTKPRLEAAGADLERCILWRFQLPRHGQELGQMVVENDIDLIVMDPIGAHLSGGISRHSDNIRTVLRPLIELIESTGTTVLIIEHALKRVPKSGHPLDAIGGSGSGLPAASRAAFVFGRDPDDEDRRILAPAKFNLGPLPKALAFEVDVDDVEKAGEQPLLVVDEELVFDPMRLFETKNQPGKVGRPSDKRAAAAEWLTTYLAENGKTKSSTVQEDSKQYGMSAKTLRRAAEDMGVVKNPPGGGRSCTWDLPDDVKELMGIKVDDDKKDEEPPDDTPVKASDVETEVTDEALAELLGEDGGDDAEGR